MDYDKMYEKSTLKMPEPAKPSEDMLKQAGCTEEEIAAFMGGTDQALIGKAGIRLKMHQLALNGDEKMLKHLAEHRLGQRSNVDLTASIKHFVIRAPEPAATVEDWSSKLPK